MWPPPDPVGSRIAGAHPVPRSCSRVCSRPLPRRMWPQFHAGPARLGVSHDRTVSRENIGRHLRVSWRRAVGTSVEGDQRVCRRSRVRRVRRSDDGRLYAFGLGGQPLWSRGIGGAMRSSPAVAHGVVYIGVNDGRLQARSVSKTAGCCGGGGSAARSRPRRWWSHGMVFIGSRGGRFLRPSRPHGADRVEPSIWSVWDGAAYRDGMVYVGSDQVPRLGVQCRTGAKRWTAGMCGRVRSTPAVTRRSRLYIGTDKGRVYALNRRTGKQSVGLGRGRPRQGVRAMRAGGCARSRRGERGAHDDPDGRHAPRVPRAGAAARLGPARSRTTRTSSTAYSNGMFLVGSFDHRLYAFGAEAGPSAVELRLGEPGRPLRPRDLVVAGDQQRQDLHRRARRPNLFARPPLSDGRPSA